MNTLFAIMVFGLVVWCCLMALGVLTLRIIGAVFDRIWPPGKR